MSILVSKNTKVFCPGLTGKQGRDGRFSSDSQWLSDPTERRDMMSRLVGAPWMAQCDVQV